MKTVDLVDGEWGRSLFILTLVFTINVMGFKSEPTSTTKEQKQSEHVEEAETEVS